MLAIFGWVQTWQVYVLAFLFGTGGAFDTPARQAFVNEMVPNAMLPNAVGLNSASFNLARMIGPATAGVIIAVLGSGIRATGWVILLNGLSYVAVVMSLKRMRSEELHPTAPLPRAKGQLRDGVRYVRVAPRHPARDGDRVLHRHVRVQLPDDHGADGDRRCTARAPASTACSGSILAIGSLAGALVGARRGELRQRLVIVSAIWFGLSRDRRRLDADLPDVRPDAADLRRDVDDADDARPTRSSRWPSATRCAGACWRCTTPCSWAAHRSGPRCSAGWPSVFGARWTLIGGGVLTVVGTLATVAFVARRQGLVMTSYVRSTRHRPPPDITGSTPVVTD